MVANQASLASRFESFQQRQPRLFMSLLALVGLCAARGIFSLFWWIFFAPAALYACAGFVTCDGVPISDGTVAFEPIAQPGVPSRTARITEGRFHLTKVHGVHKDAEYVVRVESFRKTGKKFPGPKPGEYSEEYIQFIPERFSRGSDYCVRMTAEVLHTDLKIEVQGNQGVAQQALDTQTGGF